VLRFYSRIFWSAVSDYRSVTAKLQLAGAIAVAIAAGLSRQIAERISHAWRGLPPWWSVVPVGLFVAYRVLRANYLEISALEQQLRTQHVEEEIQSRLGDLQNEGSELRTETIPSETYFDAWVTLFDKWREDVLDTLLKFGLLLTILCFRTPTQWRMN
jgi:hypothetical protein